MGFSDRYPTIRNEETPKEMEGTIHDNGSASGGTFNRLSSSRVAHFDNIKPNNPSIKDWCMPEYMDACDDLMMDPACEVNEKGTWE